MRPPAAAELLPWDSNWLGLPVARLVAGAASTAADVAAAVAQCRAAGIRLLYLVLPPECQAFVTGLKCLEAKLADVKLTYELAVASAWVPGQLPLGFQVAAATVGTPQLESLAVQSGEYSRFRHDGRIAPGAFRGLYVTWLHRALTTGRVWVVAKDVDAVGLLAFEARGEHASIELVAVAPAARRLGIGRQLVQTARREAARQGRATLRVATQSANGPARQLYEKCGFRLIQAEHIYHVWL